MRPPFRDRHSEAAFFAAEKSPWACQRKCAFKQRGYTTGSKRILNVHFSHMGRCIPCTDPISEAPGGKGLGGLGPRGAVELFGFLGAQLPAERAGVVARLGGVLGPGDDDHPGLAQQPVERHL